MAFTDDWLLQSSARLAAGGRELTTRSPVRSDWYRTKLPATVLGTLVEHGVYADPFTGENWRKLPGLGPAHENFSNHPMPEDSPFCVSWWYVKEFELERVRYAWLKLEGLNYRANVWLNGALIADSNAIAGAYREHSLLLDPALLVRGINRLAFEVFAPEPNDLAITWVDWNPSPPDKNMGLFRPAALRLTGPIALAHPQVRVRFPDRSYDFAELELFVTVENAAEEPHHVELVAELEGRRFSAEFRLAPREKKELRVGPEQASALQLGRPRLWWPRFKGEQPLYRLELSARVNGAVSDATTVTFGVRSVTSELTDRGHSLFRVNGKPILIRGGGWASDLFLRSNAERTLAEYEHVKDLNLNAIRFEGMLERSEFLDRCDRDGILVIAGFCCCDHWEKWENWKPEDLEIAAESLRSLLRRTRNHACLAAFWYGSDNPPPRHVEERYLEVLDEERWPNPTHSSATAKATELTGPSGLKMAGPYHYVPPNYWLTDTTRGGAFGFATEVSPGPAIPPLESLRAMLGEEHLWPPDECWTLHAGGGVFKSLAPFDDALAARYGAPRDLEDYVRKAQLACYEGERAMFEAFAARKYTATGVIQWMLNNAWPSLIWHLWDWYLRPAGGYFGAKLACEPLHVQYSYDDRSVLVVNEHAEGFAALRVEARLFDLEARELYREEVTVDVAPDGVTRALAVPAPTGLDGAYFAQLTLTDRDGRALSKNLYWLSTVEDRTDDARGTWYLTPMVAHADFTALGRLAPAEIDVSAALDDPETLSIALSNPGPALAFFIHMRLLQRDQGGDGQREILPVWWEDNFVTLLPAEKRALKARLPRLLDGKTPLLLEWGGWNVPKKLLKIPGRDP